MKISIFDKMKWQNSYKLIRQIFGCVTLIVVLYISHSCNSYQKRSNFEDLNTLLYSDENINKNIFLKAHLKNGGILVLLDQWNIDTTNTFIIGNGKRYDYNRNLIYQGENRVLLDSVALFETNGDIKNSEINRIAGLSFLVGFDVLLGIYCLNNPKACFGSCPTFYLGDEENIHYADAEGFSSAILPSMAYTDIDALGNKKNVDTNFTITMRNEALETHCIKDVRILYYPTNYNERVWHSVDNKFFLSDKSYSLIDARNEDNSILDLIKHKDKNEWFSLTDSTNLSSKESIYLTFDNDNSSDVGLLLDFRQTLLTTYLFYSAMGYMGNQYTEYFALLENNDSMKTKFDAIMKELGGIDVFVLSGKKWIYQGGFNETGPIAINQQIIPIHLKDKGEQIHVKLVLNKGFWRIDYTQLVNIKKEVTPFELLPFSITNDKEEEFVHSVFGNKNQLNSLPGDRYKIKFKFHESYVGKNVDLFLSSTGYYLEWMRGSWLKEKNLDKLNQMVYSPKIYLKEEALLFKKYEHLMEETFWNSKIEKNNFSYYDKE